MGVCCKLHTKKSGSWGLGREVHLPLPVLVLTSTSLICTVKSPGYNLWSCLNSMFYKHKPKRTVSSLKWIYIIRNYLVVGAGKPRALVTDVGSVPAQLSVLCSGTHLAGGWCTHLCRQASSTPSQSPERNEHTGYKLAQRTASDKIIASRNAALPLPWSPGDRQRSALCSILDYVMQITGVTPKQAHSVILLNQDMFRAWFCSMLGISTVP